jgi:hypothetical protein
MTTVITSFMGGYVATPLSVFFLQMERASELPSM